MHGTGNAILTWCGQQLARGLPPGLQGARLRCQYLINATPSLVLLMVLGYMAAFRAAGVPTLVDTCWLQLPVALAGVAWFQHQQRHGRLPGYWQACLVCQATVMTGILGGQGTAIDTHFYFLFFAVTAPLIIPVRDRLALGLVSTECLAAYLLLELRGWPAAPEVAALSIGLLHSLRLSVLVGCSAILFAAMLLSEVVMEDLQRRIVELAHTDALTGLPNRRHFHAALDTALARATRTGAPLCLALIDIDHFKQVNDRHGHDAGDEVLQQIARRLEATLRQGERIARIGGEEFALLMEHTEPLQALVALERLRHQVAQAPIEVDGQPLAVTVSLGLAAWQGPATARQLLADADEALYAAKREGRNRVVSRSPPAPLNGRAAADAGPASRPGPPG